MRGFNFKTSIKRPIKLFRASFNEGEGKAGCIYKILATVSRQMEHKGRDFEKPGLSCFNKTKSNF